jgi:hypothetical protein
MLTLARLLVASRHLDSVTRAAVVPRLQKLTGEVLYRHLFNPIPSPKSIQAIIILSLWSPIGGGAQASIRDGRLLIASGVSMAMNLRLSQAVEYVFGLRSDMKNNQGVSGTITSDLEDAMEKARLVRPTVYLSSIQSNPIQLFTVALPHECRINVCEVFLGLMACIDNNS